MANIPTPEPPSPSQQQPGAAVPQSFVSSAREDAEVMLRAAPSEVSLRVSPRASPRTTPTTNAAAAQVMQELSLKLQQAKQAEAAATAAMDAARASELKAITERLTAVHSAQHSATPAAAAMQAIQVKVPAGVAPGGTFLVMLPNGSQMQPKAAYRSSSDRFGHFLEHAMLGATQAENPGTDRLNGERLTIAPGSYAPQCTSRGDQHTVAAAAIAMWNLPCLM
ncbi:hypothetical protein Ctob_013921 [Chrysochromulina tobinii]|uniref:Uncharacterized protein n=1 Tax=Chrysochromulina tobinii TaxID=1460289 RepID=A0A0M0LH04_9EUKA|nr:hypothetical protein Ctob_013921 [Chrysochromulina tobinii]|eukprot:KOO50197.1 hypothetical protein Ctob_013921 [Chrysochromulina sp. CCMP291]